MGNIQEELQQALVCHGRGLLEQAARIYQAILTRDPDQVSALHGLGIILVQQRQTGRAIALLERAAALWPRAAAIQADLGTAYRSLGRFDRAESCYRLALQLQPESVELVDQLGLVLFSQGNFAAAAEQFRQTLRRHPDRSVSHNRLGAALQQLGDPQQALVHFRRAVQLDPGNAEAHSNLGQLLLQMNVSDQALFHAQEAVRLRPDLADTHLNLGNVWRTVGQFAQARAAFRQAIQLAPSVALSYNNLGQVFEDEGQLVEAIACYRQALEREPTSTVFRLRLAEALTRLEHFEEAVQHCQAVLAREPSCAEAHNSLGLIAITQGRPEEAIRSFRTAVALKPSWPEAYSNLGNVLQELGEFEASLACRRTALRLRPRYAVVLAQLATMLRDRLPDGELAQLRQLQNASDLSAEDRAALHFGHAQVLDARGAFAEASRQLERANALQAAVLRQRGQGFDPAEHTRSVAALIEAFSPAYFERVREFGLSTEVPVFIVGLPRSGTTLVEQILASHSQVHGAGELTLLYGSFQALPERLCRSDVPLACLPQLEAPVVQELAQRHLDWLRELDAAADRIIDKMPDNYLLLGWIATLFPKARIIYCRRDLRDVALSCWKTNFARVGWASEVPSIVNRIVEHQRIMAHWRAVLPVPICEVAYEDLVADLEGVVRPLLAFCGLEWEPLCREFYRTRRPVASASVMQVRQPIYTSSVGRWKHYESLLAPLFTPLHELMKQPQRSSSK